MYSKSGCWNSDSWKHGCWWTPYMGIHWYTTSVQLFPHILSYWLNLFSSVVKILKAFSMTERVQYSLSPWYTLLW